RDGDAMLFLNDGRYSPHSAFHVRVPLTKRDVPTVMAGNGRTGFVQTVDYRGVPVFADIRNVAGTAWFAVTKIDVAEAMAPWRVGALQLAGLLVGLLAAVGTLFFALWQLRAKVQYCLLLEAATSRATSAARLAAIVDGSQDAIVATDNDGVVTAWNPAAEHLHGYSAEEMIGQTLARLIPPGIGAGEDGILAVVRGGGWMAPYETVRLTKDGRPVDVSLSVSPIKDASGRIVGPSRISRDITEQKRVRRELDRLRWMLSPPSEGPSRKPLAQAPVCRHAARNTARLILDAAGDSLLAEIAGGFHELMGTCFAMHEANGDLAYNEHVSDWSRFLDATAIRHCASAGDCQPQACDRWRFDGCSGKNAALETMARGQPVDIERFDGTRLYSVPIRAGGEVVGSMSIGYGDPPRDPAKLAQLAEKHGVEAPLLERYAAAYETRPPLHHRAGQAAPGRVRPAAGRNCAAQPRRSAPPRNRRRTGAQQPRTRTLRPHRLARLAGTAAHGGQLHPTAGPSLPRPTRPGCARLHQLRRGWRHAHEAVDLGSAGLLARDRPGAARRRS